MLNAIKSQDYYATLQNEKVDTKLATLRRSRPTLMNPHSNKRRHFDRSFESPGKPSKLIRTQVSPSYHKEVICKASPNTKAIWHAKQASPSNPCKIAAYSRSIKHSEKTSSVMKHPIHEMMGRMRSPPVIEETPVASESLDDILGSLQDVLSQWDPYPVVRHVHNHLLF
mmetsp:Transcript_8016/g.11932  ORF Transcript_8016/g.11932 Transcript_8016/m.11932 type:complete len:169 (+) Transcript_8016:115-621(+)